MLFRVTLFFGLVVGAGITSAHAACSGPATLQAKIRAHPEAQSYEELGNWFGSHRQYSCAEDSYRAALKFEPGSARLLYLLGLSLYSSDKPQEAVDPLQQSIQLMPEVLKPHLVMALVLTELHRINEAKAQYKDALQIDPRSIAAFDGLGKLLVAEGDYRSAIGLLSAAPRDEDLTLDLADAYDKAGMLDNAADLLAVAVRHAPNSLRLNSALVTALVRQRHFEQATRLAGNAVRLHPADLDAQILYLHVLVLNDDTTVSKPLARKLLARAPHNFGVLYLNGVLERQAGQYEVARRHLQEAVALNPNHYNSRYNLGVVLEKLKDFGGAREQLEKALALGASEPEVHFELGSVLRNLGETQAAEQQLKLYQQEAKAQADRTLAASKAAQADKEFASGDPTKAVGYYREAIAAYTEDAALNYKLALALDRAGQIDDEKAALKRAIELNPGMAVAHNQLGYLASRDGDSSAAEEHFREAVRTEPAYTQAWISLAATLGMESRFSEAQEALASALRIDPQNTAALQLRKDLSAAQAQR